MTINTCMKFYTGVTLVDITATGMTRHQAGYETQRDQQRNWETVLQVIGLRSQPQLIEGPVSAEFDIDELSEFGEMYYGKHRAWIFCFGVEHEDVFLENSDPVGGLDKDFAQVPIICGLEETARFILPIFYPYGAIKNIYFKTGRINLNTV
jgi:hypothetical protein